MTRGEVRLRAAVPADAPGVATLVNQRELIDRGVSEVAAADIAARWATPEIDLAADCLIGDADGRIVGSALATHSREYVYVAADHEGRGLGARLLTWVMARSVERRAARRQPAVTGQASALMPVRARPMISFWIWLVPSYKVVTRASRK